MPYTLDQLASDIRTQLNRGPAADRAEELCACVSRALMDQAFVAKHLPDRAHGGKPREVLFEDPDLGFCICAHVYGDNANSKPHDHGSGWALYGQADGVTEMTDWKIVEPGDVDKPILVKAEKAYQMSPGDAHFYGIGDVHSPKRREPTRLIRIESENLDKVQRSNIVAANERE